MKGWKTLAFNGGTAVIIAGMTWATEVDWAAHVNPTVGMIIVLGANAVLRFFTSTAVGKPT